MKWSKIKPRLTGQRSALKACVPRCPLIPGGSAHRRPHRRTVHHRLPSEKHRVRTRLSTAWPTGLPARLGRNSAARSQHDRVSPGSLCLRVSPLQGQNMPPCSSSMTDPAMSNSRNPHGGASVAHRFPMGWSSPSLLRRSAPTEPDCPRTCSTSGWFCDSGSAERPPPPLPRRPGPHPRGPPAALHHQLPGAIWGLDGCQRKRS